MLKLGEVRKVKIVSDGTGIGTSVVDAETGEDLRMLVNGIRWLLDIVDGNIDLAVCTLTMPVVECEVVGTLTEGAGVMEGKGARQEVISQESMDVLRQRIAQMESNHEFAQNRAESFADTLAGMVAENRKMRVDLRQARADLKILEGLANGA